MRRDGSEFAIRDFSPPSPHIRRHPLPQRHPLQPHRAAPPQDPHPCVPGPLQRRREDRIDGPRRFDPMGIRPRQHEEHRRLPLSPDHQSDAFRIFSGQVGLRIR